MQSLGRMLVISVAFAAVPCVFGQNAASNAMGKPLPEFEVVSLKPSEPNGHYLVGVQLTPDQLTMNATTLKELISVAYAIPFWEISAGEGWMAPGFGNVRGRYDLTARLPQDGSAYNLRHGNYDIVDERIREMLRTMLAEQFQLKFHIETKSGKVSVLEKSGRPITLVAVQTQGGKPNNFSGVGAVEGKGVGIYNASMGQLAAFLAGYILQHPVIDKTGFDGSYNFQSKTIVTDEDFRNGDTNSMWVPAVKEMGLKLTETQGPVETFVIDHAELPAAN